MFIIHSGECGVYINDKKSDESEKKTFTRVAILTGNTVVGHSSVVEVEPVRRSATVVAHSEVITLELTKADFQKTLYQHELLEKMRRLEFLKGLPLFQDWDPVEVSEFNNCVSKLKLAKGSVLYEIDDDPSTFYIVLKGQLTMETIIEIDSYFRYPIDSRKWEVRKTTRQIRYKLTNLRKGAFFGHEEILQGFKRRCRVRCQTNCSLIYLNKGQHGQWAPDQWAPE